MKKLFLICAILATADSWAGVYKCTDAAGKTDYQSSPCAEQHQAVRMNPKTGGEVDLNAVQRQQEQEQAKKAADDQKLQADAQAALEKDNQTKRDAQAEYDKTKALVGQRPQQFSAYAIPRYDPEKLPDAIKSFAQRLPDIERLRRLAALKALASNECQRVEADELNARSTLDALVILINCSSGKSFYFSETELIQP